MMDQVYGQSETDEQKAHRLKREDFFKKVGIRAKQIKRKRKLQNKYHLTR